MKARINTYLNIRTGKPEVLPNNNPADGYYKPGDEIEIAETVSGENYKDNKLWYKLTNGTFVWSGGVDGNLKGGIYPWWLNNSLFSIPKLWEILTEQVVKVAILDTGISKHVDFDFSKITGYNYLSNTNDYLNDNHGHGTHLAGIIAARGIKSYGIAPETLLFIAKVCDDSGRPVIESVKNALNDIYLEKNGGNGIRIINMSFSVPSQSAEDDKIIDDIKSLINKLVDEKKCLIVASSGSKVDAGDSFPARMTNCIAVGSINSGLTRSAFSRITSVLDIMAPGEAISSSSKTDSTIDLDGTSQAAAFVTGVCALAIEKMKNKQFDADLFTKVLFQTAYSNSFTIQEYGHGIINPNKLVETTKQL
ncbi:MAG: S8 family serine peptidase [Bacteroidetes bacterium]|nr:S8 family serine peptidase [Bacteroidota bacterium]